MQIHIDSITEVKKKLTITVDEDHLQEHIEEAYEHLRKNAQIPGFRKGKTPRSVLEKRFGASVQAEVYQEIMRETMTKALEEKELDAITIFDVSKPEHEKGKGLVYSASVEIRPNIEIKNYKSIPVKQNKDDVTDANIEDVLKRIQESQAVMKPLEAQTPAKGQYASILIEQLDENGQSIEKEAPQEQFHMVGHDSARKDVDQAIAKMKVGDTQDLTLEEEGKDAKLYVRITLTGVKEKELPTLNDDFAKTVGPFENLEALKKRIEEDLRADLEERKKTGYALEILETLRKQNPTAFPETLLEQEMLSLKQEFFNRIVQSGQSLGDDFSVEKMQEEIKPEAERRVHDQILLGTIAKLEDIKVENKELEDKIHELAHMYKKPAQEMYRDLEKNNRLDTLRFQILSQKTLDFLIGQANIK